MIKGFPKAAVTGALSRKRVICWTAAISVAAIALGIYLFLKPSTWRCYTDETSLTRQAKQVDPHFVAWEQPEELAGALGQFTDDPAPSISSDGTVMVFVREVQKNNRDLFLCRWDGNTWSAPFALRALNSKFNERSPAFSRDGSLLYFATDRPGSLGNYDIWVARWDGAVYAWPLPLTQMVNSPYDELDPAPSASGDKLYFSSNKPDRPAADQKEGDLDYAAKTRMPGLDHDIFAADIVPAGVTNREIERATSMLYYLRESALASPRVMKLLGGSAKSEAAVSKSLAWLASSQEKDGHWELNKYAGNSQHNMGGTAIALLAFLGRGQRHDKECEYQDTVKRAIDYLISQQDPLEGDLTGKQGNMYDHGIASLAMAEAYGVTKHEDLLLPAQIAIDFIVQHQSKRSGGWRYNPGDDQADLSVAGWQIMALKSAQFSGLRVPAETFEGVRRWLKHVSGGKKGGIYGYEKSDGGNRPAMTATGYFCSQLMGLSPNTFSAFETSDFIQGKANNNASRDSYLCYYATLCSYQNQGKLWRKWRDIIHRELPASQSKEGYWQPQGAHSDQMGRVVYTSLLVLSLQAHYRYTPLYGLGFEPDRKLATSPKERDALRDMPLYRRAKRLDTINSRGDDLQPCITAHGDFLYFASDRFGGEGGLDLYRTRISGESPTEPTNLGPVINGARDDTGPALRMHGFNLIFGSSRGQDKDKFQLLGTHSRRVFEEHVPGNVLERRYLKLIRGRILALFLVAAALVLWLFLVHWSGRRRRKR